MYVMKRPNKIRVDITDGDIKNGVRRACAACPIALALSRTIGKPCIVGPVCWWVDGDDTHECQKLGREVANFRSLFDQGEKVWPMAFYVDKW